MTENNPRCGACGSPAVIVIALALAIVLPLAGFYVSKLFGAKPAGDFSDEAVLQRIRPVAQLALAGGGDAAPAAKGSEEIYKGTCSACHDSGVADAPKLGDKAAWAPRIAQGLAKLAASGIQGKGAMPPKGGADISDADFTRVVAWMANKAGAGFKEPAAPKAAAAPAAPAPAAAVVAEAPAAAAPAAAPAASADSGKGKKTYESACVACHASGVAGAPKFGDKAAWAPRIASGLDALTNSAIKGKGAMPPKGGNPSIPDADIRAAVEYMTAAAR